MATAKKSLLFDLVVVPIYRKVAFTTDLIICSMPKRKPFKLYKKFNLPEHTS